MSQNVKNGVFFYCSGKEVSRGEHNAQVQHTCWCAAQRNNFEILLAFKTLKDKEKSNICNEHCGGSCGPLKFIRLE